jgi:hypothetical protein
MRLLFLILLHGLLTGSVFGKELAISDSTRTDSAFVTPISTTPIHTQRKLSSYGYYVGHVNDPYTAHIFSGVNVLNMLRGNMPGLSLSAGIPTATGGVRSNQSLLVVDGIASNIGLLGNYNFNSFDYHHISASGSPNAGMLYGGNSGDGTIFISSKTGEGYSRPSFEFNSYTTFIKDDIAEAGYLGNFPDRWIFTNSLAYQQDFGAIDTRVSYNFSTYPFSDSDIGHNHTHNLKVNTGAKFGNRLSARLIFDYSDQNVKQLFPPSTSFAKTDRNHTQGNLLVQYQATDWLKFTSQHAMSKGNVDGVYFYENNQHDQERKTHNLLASFNKQFHFLEITGFAGYQIEDTKFKSSHQGNFSQGWQGNQFSNEGFLGGLEMTIARAWYFDFHYRADNPSLYPPDKKFNSWSISNSFIFSDAFRLANETFTSGKVRMAFGKTDLGLTTPYPGRRTGQDPSKFGVTTLSPRSSVELGGDLHFFKDRLTISSTYYRYRDKDAPFNSSFPGSPYPIMNIADLETNGWEVGLGVMPIKTRRVNLTSTLFWWKANTETVGLNGNPGSGGVVVLGRANPYWSASVQNRLVCGNIFLNVLIDMFEADRLIPDGNPPSMRVKRNTMGSVRDLTAGFSIPQSMLHKINLQGALISCSMRNYVTLFSEDPGENSFFLSGPMKSISISLSVTF